MHVHTISHRRFSPPGAATGGAHSLAVLIPHSRSGAVHTTSMRGYRRPAVLFLPGQQSVAGHFIVAGAFERCRPQLLHRQTKHQRPCKFSDARHLVPSRHVCRPSDDNHGEEHVGSDQKDVGEYQNVDC